MANENGIWKKAHILESVKSRVNGLVIFWQWVSSVFKINPVNKCNNITRFLHQNQHLYGTGSFICTICCIVNTDIFCLQLLVWCRYLPHRVKCGVKFSMVHWFWCWCRYGSQMYFHTQRTLNYSTLVHYLELYFFVRYYPRCYQIECRECTRARRQSDGCIQSKSMWLMFMHLKFVYKQKMFPKFQIFFSQKHSKTS